MKKFLTLALMLLALVLALALCGEYSSKETNPTVNNETPNCEHTIVTDPTVESTCTATGLTEGMHCPKCGMIFVAQKTVPIAPHRGGDWILDVEPTTTQEGLNHIECLDCHNTIKTETIDKLPLVASNGLEFTFNDDGASYSVTGIGSCTDTDIVIPSTYEGLPVTAIGNRAFERCEMLTGVKIPYGVKSIGSTAFYCCSALTRITIPTSVTSIGDLAFTGCSSLKSIIIPHGVKSIGRGTLASCDLLESITLPNSVTIIGDEAFLSCPSLTSITIPYYVTSIGEYAFANCTALTSITIPSFVTTIGDSAFLECKSLESINIPDGVTSIGDSAFMLCSSLTSVIIPESIESIGKSAFWNCTSLTIYCEAESQPSGWDSNWNYSECPVVWGYKSKE